MSCQACGKSVFAAEKAAGIKVSFHKSCFRCANCSTALRDKFDDHAGKFYCTKCHQSLFLSAEERQEMEYTINSSARKQSVMHAKAVIPGSGGSPLPFKTKTLSPSESAMHSSPHPPAVKHSMPAGVLSGIRSASSSGITRSSPAPAPSVGRPVAAAPPAKPSPKFGGGPAPTKTPPPVAHRPPTAAAAAPAPGFARFCSSCGKSKTGKFCSGCGQPS